MHDSSVSLDGSAKGTIALIFAHGLDEVAKGKIPMRTVAQFSSTGIQTVADLQESLGLAANLKFSTLPPYLCAEWSIKDQSDPAEPLCRKPGVYVQFLYSVDTFRYKMTVKRDIRMVVGTGNRLESI